MAHRLVCGRSHPQARHARAMGTATFRPLPHSPGPRTKSRQTSFRGASHTLYFYKLKVHSNPASGKPAGAISRILFAHFVSLRHKLFLKTFQAFSSLFYLLCGV